ncbi:unnamed protein product [Amoebophrya sp. A120]|nr:unnamed protein product [Amoebophrya sp. A120]|eukprot:GSA120T00005434001.1
MQKSLRTPGSMKKKYLTSFLDTAQKSHQNSVVRSIAFEITQLQKENEDVNPLDISLSVSEESRDADFRWSKKRLHFHGKRRLTKDTISSCSDYEVEPLEEVVAPQQHAAKKRKEDQYLPQQVQQTQKPSWTAKPVEKQAEKEDNCDSAAGGSGSSGWNEKQESAASRRSPKKEISSSGAGGESSSTENENEQRTLRRRSRASGSGAPSSPLRPRSTLPLLEALKKEPEVETAEILKPAKTVWDLRTTSGVAGFLKLLKEQKGQLVNRAVEEEPCSSEQPVPPQAPESVSCVDDFYMEVDDDDADDDDMSDMVENMNIHKFLNFLKLDERVNLDNELILKTFDRYDAKRKKNDKTQHAESSSEGPPAGRDQEVFLRGGSFSFGAALGSSMRKQVKQADVNGDDSIIPSEQYAKPETQITPESCAESCKLQPLRRCKTVTWDGADEGADAGTGGFAAAGTNVWCDEDMERLGEKRSSSKSPGPAEFLEQIRLMREQHRTRSREN